MGKLSLTEYLYEVEQRLNDCPKKVRNQLIDALKEEMEDLLREVSGCSSYEEMVEIFGSPEEIAQQLLNANQLKKHGFAKKGKMIGFLVALVAVCSLFFGMAWWIWVHSQERVEVGTYVSEPIEISDSEFEDLFEEEP